MGIRDSYESRVDRPVVKDLQRVLQTDRPANWGSQASQPDWHKAMEKPDFARQFTQAMDCRGVFLARALALARRRRSGGSISVN